MATRKLERLDTVAALQVGDCFVRATLDTRHANADPEHRYTVVLTFYIKGEGKTIYKKLPYAFTKKEFHEICKNSGRNKGSAATEGERKTLNDAKAGITDEFNTAVEQLRDIARQKPITRENVLSLLGKKEKNSFTDMWEEFNATKSVGTRMSYENARKSFIKAVGRVNHPYITAEDIRKWEKSMAGVSKTTIGIYERACKAAWNEAVKRKMASRDDYPFGKIPTGATRKRNWLDVEKMTELYGIFTSKTYPPEWTQAQSGSVHRALGLFLFQYLANGCNMADTAQLTYNDDYYRYGGRMLTFVRQKTENRTGTEVVIPVTPQLRAIMDDIASKPERRKHLFPFILRGTKDPAKAKARVAQANKNVNKWMDTLAAHLGWNTRPGNTWARHSFATNMTHAGVPQRYISEAMGHAIGDITSRYIDLYPLDMQLNYNSRLLNTDTPAEENTPSETVTLTRQEYEALLSMLKTTK